MTYYESRQTRFRAPLGSCGAFAIALAAFSLLSACAGDPTRHPTYVRASSLPARIHVSIIREAMIADAPRLPNHNSLPPRSRRLSDEVAYASLIRAATFRALREKGFDPIEVEIKLPSIFYQPTGAMRFAMGYGQGRDDIAMLDRQYADEVNRGVPLAIDEMKRDKIAALCIIKWTALAVQRMDVSGPVTRLLTDVHVILPETGLSYVWGASTWGHELGKFVRSVGGLSEHEVVERSLDEVSSYLIKETFRGFPSPVR